MENQHISSLFQKIKARLQKQMLDRESVSRIIFEIAKVKLGEDEMDLKNGILTLKISALKKNEIKIKKEAIIMRIASETSVAISDIR